MFRKKLKICYDDNLSLEDAKSIFKTVPHNFPGYFRTMHKNFFDPVVKKFLPFTKTIKSCPGFVNLYKRSLLMTCPFDVYAVFKDNEIYKQKAGTNLPEMLTIHDDPFVKYAGNHDYKFIVKLWLAVQVHSDVSFIVSDSLYHFNKRVVFPGIIDKDYKFYMSCFIPIKKDQDELYLKKGDPLLLLTPMCENKIKLSFEKIQRTEYTDTKFSSLKRYVMDKIL